MSHPVADPGRVGSADVPWPCRLEDERVLAEEFLAGSPVGLAVLARVRAVVADLGGCDERTSKSQVAFRRRRGFAYLWRPGQYLRRPAADVVLSIALGRADPSPRFKKVVEPAPGCWMHHLELHGPEEIDDEVARWLREAASFADQRAERPRGPVR